MKASLFVTVFVAFVQYVQSQSQCVPEDGVTVSSTTHPKANGCYTLSGYDVLGHTDFIQTPGVAVIWPVEIGDSVFVWEFAFENTAYDFIVCVTNSEPVGNPGQGGVEIVSCSSGLSLPIELSFSCGCSSTPSEPENDENDPTCEFGIIKNNICCAPECGSCGGFGCGSRGGEKCCGEPIIASGLSCDSNSAPCIISPPPIEIPQPDPNCSLGIIGSSIIGMNLCCPTECGTCGHTGCGGVFPGSYAMCCGSSILSSEVSCDDTNSPCIISMAPTPTASTTSEPTSLAPTPDSSTTPGPTSLVPTTMAPASTTPGPTSLAPTPTSSTTPEPTSLGSDPTCEFGIIGNTAAGSNICCDTSCETCGGIGCSLRPGGSQKCCGEVIRASELSCNDHTSPCVIGLP